METSPSVNQSRNIIGESEKSLLATPQRRSLNKRNQPRGSPNSTQSTTYSAASLDLAGRIMAFDNAHTVVGKNGEKNHGAGSPMHKRNRSAGSSTKESMEVPPSPLEFNEKRDDSDDFKLSTTHLTSDTLSTISKQDSTISKQDSEQLPPTADKESVVSSASRISSLSQKILQNAAAAAAERSTADDINGKDSVVSSASRISSLSQQMIRQVANDDKESEDSILLSANLIASLSQKILEKQNQNGGSADSDSVVSSAQLITSLSQRILQSRGTTSSTKARRSFKESHSSRSNQGTSFEKVQESSNGGDKDSSVGSSASQMSSVSQRIKALEKNSSSFTSQVSPRASFNSNASGKPPRSSISKTSTNIDPKSMSRIQERIRAMRQADATSPRPNRPSWANRSNNNNKSPRTTSPRYNPQDATRPISPPTGEALAALELPQDPPPQQVEASNADNNISAMTMESDGVASTASRPKSSPPLELTLQNVSELSALPDPKLPPDIQRTHDHHLPNTPRGPGSHVSLPNPIASAMDSMREYRKSNALASANYSEWFPQEHFAIANALFPEHQFGVNDDEIAKQQAAISESQSLPPMRVRSHSEGDEIENLDDHGFPKFLEAQRDSSDKVPHHIQFSDLERMEEEDRPRGDHGNEDDENRRRVTSWADLGREVLKYDWKDKVPLIGGCLVILIGIIVGITLATTSGPVDEFVNFDMDQPPSAQLCAYVQAGYSIPGEEKMFEVDLNWVMDVSFDQSSASSSRLTDRVQELFQQRVIPKLLGCGEAHDVLEGQYLIGNGYAWSVRDIGNCDPDSLSPCSRLLVSFVLWTKAYRDSGAMNDFASANFGNAALVEQMEEDDDMIQQIALVRMSL